MRAPQLQEIQGLLRHGYPYFDRAAYCLFHIGGNRAGARAWLAQLVADIDPPWIVSAHVSKPRIEDYGRAVAIAFTASGLRELGLTEDALASFVPEFREGMAALHRARLLGDVGASAPSTWQWGAQPGIDGVLMVFAPREHPETRRTLDNWLDAVKQIPGCPHILRVLIGRQKLGVKTQVSKEPFGFADGISQPVVQGLNDRGAPPGVRVIRAGEFVLGYLNEIDRLPASPSVAPAEDPGHALPPLPSIRRGDLGRNGTFMVMRQLEQEVQVFEDFIDDDEYLAAQMVGRWRSGGALVQYDEEVGGMTQRELEAENDFAYHREDRHGFKCPIGAHIRRANPRDALAEGLGIDPEEAQRLVDQHRILRRGRVYKESGRQGLLFICLNTNIERQFEFIQSSWLMNPEFGGLSDETDPIIGNAPRRMTIQHPLLGKWRANLPQFVTVRGGGYFFLPGLRALRYLSQL